jgi:hypothetical protein
MRARHLHATLLDRASVPFLKMLSLWLFRWLLAVCVYKCVCECVCMYVCVSVCECVDVAYSAYSF